MFPSHDPWGQRRTVLSNGATVDDLPSYTVNTEPFWRQIDVITAELHLKDWTINESDIATSEEGNIHTELTIDTLTGPFISHQYRLAMFDGAEVQRIENKFRVKYKWVRMGMIPSFPEEAIGPSIPLTGQDIMLAVENTVTVPDDQGVSIPTGFFYPHTTPQIYRLKDEVAGQQVAPELLDPIYYESPRRTTFNFTSNSVLPGLDDVNGFGGI